MRVSALGRLAQRRQSPVFVPLIRQALGLPLVDVQERAMAARYQQRWDALVQAYRDDFVHRGVRVGDDLRVGAYRVRISVTMYVSWREQEVLLFPTQVAAHGKSSVGMQVYTELWRLCEDLAKA